MAKTIYGLIGSRLGHSFSGSFFSAMFAANGIDADYLNFELPDIGDLMEMISEQPDLRGFNVTMPYKEQILPYLDEMTDEVMEIGAANVVKVEQSGGEVCLRGYNTDVDGFVKSLAPMLTPGIDKALILGSGGASKAVAYGLRRLAIEPLTVTRTPGADATIGYDDLTREVIEKHRLIVNTTPLGMWPDISACPPLPYDLLGRGHICYDLIYNPSVTMFMRNAAEHGARVCNGLGMLLTQAFESWNIWQQ